MIGVDSASAVLAQLAIPAIAVSRNPGVNSLRDKMNSRHQEQPRQQLPPRQRFANSGPRVHAGVNTSVAIYRLHQAHGLLEVYLRKPRGHVGIMQIQQFDPAARIDLPHSCNTGAAQPAVAVV